MKQLRNDRKNLDQLTQALQQISMSFLDSVAERPAASDETKFPELPPLPKNSPGAAHALTMYKEIIEPHLSASVGPRYFGFVTGGTTPAALLGDWLAATVDQNTAGPGDSIANAIEQHVIKQLLELFLLPDTYTGVLTTGATSANLLGLLTARQYAGQNQGIDIAKQGMFALDVEVFSATPHASTIKAMGLAGFGQEQITTVACLENTEEMDCDDLQQKLSNSSAKSKIVIASAGTVNTTDFDDLHRVAEICREHQAWLHVDAAFGIFARTSPNYQDLANGLELADSITADGHKWLNVPYDCGFFFTRHENLLQQTCAVVAPYLKVESQYPNYAHFGIENSRRFRALPVWFGLQAYGREGYGNITEHNCVLAKKLAEWIKQSDQYELLRPCKLNVVLFRATTDANDPCEFNKALLNKINRAGKVFLTPGAWKNHQGMRAAFSNWSTTSEDLDILISELRQHSASA